jgi:malonyl-CoA O-methyltransferase
MKRHIDVQTAYNRWSDSYDAQQNPLRDLDLLILQRLITDLMGKVVVEAGCGTGKNSQWLAQRCRQLIGLDFSEGMLALARQKVRRPNAQFIHHDIRQPWPVAAETADLVLINLVLEHIEQMEPIFHNAAAVMCPTAQLLVTDLHPDRVTMGKGAEITALDETIVNFVHPVADYIAAANGAGLQLVAEKGWPADLPDAADAPNHDSQPLLLSLSFTK